MGYNRGGARRTKRLKRAKKEMERLAGREESAKPTAQPSAKPAKTGKA